MKQIVIVGAGRAGHAAAVQLHGMADDIRVRTIGGEIEHPYDRPPLSKDYLLQPDMPAPHLTEQHVYDRIALERGVSAVRVDPRNRIVVTDRDEEIPYDRLLLATGSRSRPLPCPFDADAIQPNYLRSLADAQQLRKQLSRGGRLLIVGGGYIGLEVAVAARSLGCEVTIVENRPVLLARTGSAALGEWVKRVQDGLGVRVLLGATIESLTRNSAGAIVASLRGGAVVEADILLAAVGVEPNTELAVEAGLHVEDGIVVDAGCRTSDPDIFAAGEVTNYPVSALGGRFRTESWAAAGRQPITAARCMLGAGDTFDEVPWMWSDLGPHNVQCLGLPNLATSRNIVGDPAGDSWLEIGFGTNGQFVSATAVNSGRSISRIKQALKRTGRLPDDLVQ